MPHFIPGNKIQLRPAVSAYRRQVYDWLANSDVTSLMLGPPKFPDHPVPSWDEFCADYIPHYFDDSDPHAGRCYIIVADGKGVGSVAYNDLDFARKETELDIWLGSRAVCGKGFGTDALQAICRYLAKTYGIERFIIRPSRRNTDAIAAYNRAGFVKQPRSVAEHEAIYGQGDYIDSVLLVKSMTS